jgi:hypothetical protein
MRNVGRDPLRLTPGAQGDDGLPIVHRQEIIIVVHRDASSNAIPLKTIKSSWCEAGRKAVNKQRARRKRWMLR